MGNFNTNVTPLRENSYVFIPYGLPDNLLAKYEMGIKIYCQIGYRLSAFGNWWSEGQDSERSRRL